jgi:hypothetical protein
MLSTESWTVLAAGVRLVALWVIGVDIDARGALYDTDTVFDATAWASRTTEVVDDKTGAICITEVIVDEITGALPNIGVVVDAKTALCNILVDLGATGALCVTVVVVSVNV